MINPLNKFGGCQGFEKFTPQKKKNVGWIYLEAMLFSRLLADTKRTLNGQKPKGGKGNLLLFLSLLLLDPKRNRIFFFK